MIKLQPLKLLMILFALSSCGHIEQKIETGPLVTGCVVDTHAGGYQCAALNQPPFFLKLEDAKSLLCMSPQDLESYLKACKKGQLIEVPVCSRDCADNSYCLTISDWGRISQRCNSKGY